jgi:hypothetical protein
MITLSYIHTEPLRELYGFERTLNREFADEESKYKSVRASVVRLLPVIHLPWSGLKNECQASQRDVKQYPDPVIHATGWNGVAAMTTTQVRLVEIIKTFYNVADRTSDSAMTSHAFKNEVEELDGSIQKLLISDTCSCRMRLSIIVYRKVLIVRPSWNPQEDERILSHRQRAYHQPTICVAKSR